MPSDMLEAAFLLGILSPSSTGQALKPSASGTFRLIQTLFGNSYDMSNFPVKGGTGILAKTLCFPVSLLEIEKWFLKLRSQKTVVHEEMTAMLSSRGLTWPPNVQGFQHCSSYKRQPSSGKLAVDDHARSALLPTYMSDDLAMCEHFFSEEASMSGAQALSLGAQDETLLIADSLHSSQRIGQVSQGPANGTHCTKHDVDQELEACSSDLTSLKRNQAWVPAGPKNILKFVAWDTGKEQFHNSPKDRLQARVMVFLIEKLEEVCGQRSSNDVFLKCLVKTRQWQDTQIHNRSDCKPWVAYVRTLCCLDAELSRSNAITVVQCEGFQQKVLQWVDECLQSTQLVLSHTVWDMLNRMRQWQGQEQHQSDVQLRAWKDSFLCEPLHYQWMTQAEILQTADSHPFNLGHNCGSVTSLFASVLHPADFSKKKGAMSVQLGCSNHNSPGLWALDKTCLVLLRMEGSWLGCHVDGTASASAFQHQIQLQAGYLLTNEEALAAVQLNMQVNPYAGLPALETANAQTQFAGQASAYSAGQPSAVAEGGAYSIAHALADTCMGDYNADQDRHQSQAQMQTGVQAEAGTLDEMFGCLPSNLPAAVDWPSHGIAQAPGLQQGSPAGTTEVIVCVHHINALFFEKS
ncbi:TPA: hypothetical protein ACH3X1_009662 [Trebouxia sp. C0004]